MVGARGRGAATHTVYYLKPGQTLQNTKVSERSLALIVPKSEFERFNDYANESRRAALLAEREAKRLADLREASYDMTKSWKDTIQNMQNRRRDELLSQKKVEEARGLTYLKEAAAKTVAERAELVKQARELILYRNPQCRSINRALFTSEVLRELNEQVKFLKSRKDAQREFDQRQAESVLEDVRKFHEEEREIKRARLKKIMDHNAELDKQIEGNRKELRRIEESIRKTETDDLRNMTKELEDTKNDELREALKKKEALNAMFLEAIEERKRHELRLKEEDAFQEKNLKIYREMKYEIDKLTKEKIEIRRQERVRRIEMLARRLGKIVEKRQLQSEAEEKKKKEETDKQTEEKRKAEELERLEEKKRKREQQQQQMKAIEKEKEKKKKEEEDLKVWETLQRYKRDEFNKEWNLRHFEEEKDKRLNYGKVLRKQMTEKEAERRIAQIEADDSAEVKEMINKANERVLMYGEKVLQESRGIRPLFTIEKAIERFKREAGLIPPFKREEEAPTVPKSNVNGKLIAVDMPTTEERPKQLPAGINFLNAGLSGICATCIVHPMDVVKNRMQMSKERASALKTARGILRKEGLPKFYAGLSAGILRQATYTTTRLGLYNQLMDVYKGRHDDRNPRFLHAALLAGFAGSVAAFVGNPAEVALIRMSSDGRLPPEQRRNYKGVANAFARIVKEEGAATLWKGSIATVGRAAVVNVSQLATYSQTKLFIASEFGIEEGVTLHFCAAMLSGLVTSFNSMPLDIAKTRIQNLEASERCAGMLKTVFQIARDEGIRALWKGFWPYYGRIGPHTVLTFLFNEQFARLYKLYFVL